MNYTHGMPFSEKLGQNIVDLLNRIKEKKASMIIIDGGLGEGKTTLAVEIADYANKLQGLPYIVFEEQLALGGEEFVQKFRLCFNKNLPAIIYDESGDFNRRGSLTSFNMMINRTFEMFRAYGTLVILCLPTFAVLDADLYTKNIPKLLLHLRNRTKGQGNFSAYSLYRMLYVKKRMEKLTVKSFAYTVVDPNFYGHFINLEHTRSLELDRYSIKGKKIYLKKAEIKLQGLSSYSEIADKLGRGIQWCRMINYRLKIKPTKVIDRVHYFNEENINRMGQELLTPGRKPGDRC